MEITGSRTAMCTWEWLERYSWEVFDHLLAGSDFHIFGPLKKHLVVRIATMRLSRN